MKKNFLNFLSLGLIVSIFAFSGCSEEDATTKTIDKSKKATLIVRTHAQLDLLNDTAGNFNIETPPAGTKVFIRVDNSEYEATAQGVSVYETEIDANGEFTYEVPATDNGLTVMISLDEFLYDQKQVKWSTSANTWIYDTPKEKRFYVGDTPVMLYAGENKFMKITYSYEDFK